MSTARLLRSCAHLIQSLFHERRKASNDGAHARGVGVQAALLRQGGIIGDAFEKIRVERQGVFSRQRRINPVEARPIGGAATIVGDHAGEDDPRPSRLKAADQPHEIAPCRIQRRIIEQVVDPEFENDEIGLSGDRLRDPGDAHGGGVPRHAGVGDDNIIAVSPKSLTENARKGFAVPKAVARNKTIAEDKNLPRLGKRWRAKQGQDQAENTKFPHQRDSGPNTQPSFHTNRTPTRPFGFVRRPRSAIRRPMDRLKILLIGSGGREHALANALARSRQCAQLFIAPGNPGTARVGSNVALDPANHAAVLRFCRDQGVGLVVVGPEQPLIGGLVDALTAAGVPAFGPTQAAARLEGSKGFTKDICRTHHIPTASYERFSDRERALAYVRAQGAPIVIKADGLAAGKGVVVAMTLAEAEAAIDLMFDGAFGASGAEVVIEAFLEGEEASFFAICDGLSALPFATAQDHKRVGDGDVGPNTGGMGAYSPASVVTPEIAQRVMEEIITPTLTAMRDLGAPFRGVLYAGLMLTKEGPKLIEYNVRFGDPEAQAILPRFEGDLVGLMLAAANGALPDIRLTFTPQSALTVVLAARGYPGTPQTGTEISGLDRVESRPGVVVTHAGTRLEGGRLLAAGGRVINVTALADSVQQARDKAYAAVDAINWPGGFCRRDIGWREVERER